MAFKVHLTDDGRVPGIEYLPCGAIKPQIGMALVQTSGKLAAATGTNAPKYISMCSRDSACEDGEIIPVIRVNADMVFETTLAVAGTALKPGDKVTLHTDGLQVTATTTSGVAEITAMDGTAAGSAVCVRFA